MRFKVGDIITGKYRQFENGIPYHVTTADAIMSVMKVDDCDKHTINVCVLRHKSLRQFEGSCYWVNPSWFVLEKRSNEVL